MKPKNYRGRKPVGDWGPGKCRPEFKDEANINLIVERARKGYPPPITAAPLVYSDLPAPHDLHEALIKVDEALESFKHMPAEIREHVNNDPVQFMEWVNEGPNREELISLGLMEPEPIVEDPAEPQPNVAEVEEPPVPIVGGE